MTNSINTLADAPIGAEVVVRAFVGDLEHAQRLREMGVLVGTTLKIIRFAPLGDPIEFEVRGYRISLRASEAERVRVSLPS